MKHANEKIDAEERQNIRMILNVYFDLYEHDPEFFALSKDEEDNSIKKYTL